MFFHFMKQRSSVLRSMLSIAAVIAALGFATTPAQAQTGGRSVTRTCQGDSKPTFTNTFHGGDQPQPGDTGGVGGWDPTLPPTLTWIFGPDGNMYVDDSPIMWRYDSWQAGHGEVWYHNDSGWHYWGTWDKKGTFSASPPIGDDARCTSSRDELVALASGKRDLRTSSAA